MSVLFSQRVSTYIMTPIVKCIWETVGGRTLPLICSRTARRHVYVNAALQLQ